MTSYTKFYKFLLEFANTEYAVQMKNTSEASPWHREPDVWWFCE